MYSIVEVAYGVPITQKMLDICDELGEEPDDLGITTLYNGGGDEAVGYIGVKLSEFDEATEMAMPVSTIRLKPTPAEVKKAKKIIASLNPKIKAAVDRPLDVYFVFGSS